ncbi:phage baseplate plug family protein [Achromobacter insolitus]|uniref:phage baseplate plug family protein n=1 Tax=Achromobacter insolitus TaxID=217204 RepID=UPI0013E385D6|nr:hypothetical protein [Achromobacter insolitus]MCP1404572.1 hypothetical protein [Achromobacter insolitus]NGT16918.1 hypothetical protein [Achromobacter insolitus]
MIEIPVLGANDSLTEIELDGTTYFLRLSWNSEAEVWALSIENAYNEVIVAGIAVVPDTPLLAPYRHLAVPAGELVALAPDRRESVSRAALPAGEVALVYIGEGELADGTI